MWKEVTSLFLVQCSHLPTGSQISHNNLKQDSQRTGQDSNSVTADYKPDKFLL